MQPFSFFLLAVNVSILLAGSKEGLNQGKLVRCQHDFGNLHLFFSHMKGIAMNRYTIDMADEETARRLSVTLSTLHEHMTAMDVPGVDAHIRAAAHRVLAALEACTLVVPALQQAIDIYQDTVTLYDLRYKILKTYKRIAAAHTPPVPDATFKAFLTEQPVFIGPKIYAGTWDEARTQADLLGVKLLGVIDSEYHQEPG